MNWFCNLPTVKAISSSIKGMTSSKKTADYYIMKRLLNVINNIKSTLIPIILGLLAKFGITKVQELIGKGED